MRFTQYINYTIRIITTFPGSHSVQFQYFLSNVRYYIVILPAVCIYFFITCRQFKVILICKYIQNLSMAGTYFIAVGHQICCSFPHWLRLCPVIGRKWWTNYGEQPRRSNFGKPQMKIPSSLNFTQWQSIYFSCFQITYLYIMRTLNVQFITYVDHKMGQVNICLSIANYLACWVTIIKSLVTMCDEWGAVWENLSWAQLLIGLIRSKKLATVEWVK